MKKKRSGLRKRKPTVADRWFSKKKEKKLRECIAGEGQFRGKKGKGRKSRAEGCAGGCMRSAHSRPTAEKKRLACDFRVLVRKWKGGGGRTEGEALASLFNNTTEESASTFSPNTGGGRKKA